MPPPAKKTFLLKCVIVGDFERKQWHPVVRFNTTLQHSFASELGFNKSGWCKKNNNKWKVAAFQTTAVKLNSHTCTHLASPRARTKSRVQMFLALPVRVPCPHPNTLGPLVPPHPITVIWRWPLILSATASYVSERQRDTEKRGESRRPTSRAPQGNGALYGVPQAAPGRPSALRCPPTTTFLLPVLPRQLVRPSAGWQTTSYNWVGPLEAAVVVAALRISVC